MKESLRWKYKLLLHKKYFDTGFGQLHYVRYIILLWGLDKILKDTKGVALIGAIIYGIICYLVGWAWYKYEWVLANAEVGNHFNLLARELRKYMNNKKV